MKRRDGLIGLAHDIILGVTTLVVAVFLREGALVPVYVAAAAASATMSGVLYVLKRDAAVRKMMTHKN